ncbi:MAG: DUF427 domain-containing protein [Thermoleophilaceae bacterium]|nr:DUF427 domain-containing protein [Thermoleophilaceae bacterium]
MSESVWDYPRPPAVVPCARRVQVELAGTKLADSARALRVLETSHPPTIYVPSEDVELELLSASPRPSSLCEWKGSAQYLDVEVAGRRDEAVAWRYPRPVDAYAALEGHICFYPSRMDACWLGDERVAAQPGDFYGGWVTSDLEGPFKGAPGTRHGRVVRRK